MATKSPKRLVIDSSIAHASGGLNATHPTAKNCRDFLIKVRKLGHFVVFTPDIRKEWDKHQSIFASEWRVSMRERKKTENLPHPKNEELWAKIEEATANENDREAMQKDFRLVEAALATDKIVASLDDTVRNLFAAVCITAGELKIILWLNPDKTEENCLDWLNEGAKHDKSRQLVNWKV